MFQEPVRFIEDAIRNDRSVLTCCTATTVCESRACEALRYAGCESRSQRLGSRGDADKYQRGGLLPMAVFLTQTSPGLRTSPVKRGYWVVHKVLGEVIPPPPPVVPELPQDEAKSELPLRDMLARHRANPVCGRVMRG